LIIAVFDNNDIPEKRKKVFGGRVIVGKQARRVNAITSLQLVDKLTSFSLPL